MQAFEINYCNNCNIKSSTHVVSFERNTTKLNYLNHKIQKLYQSELLRNIKISVIFYLWSWFRYGLSESNETSFLNNWYSSTTFLALTVKRVLQNFKKNLQRKNTYNVLIVEPPTTRQKFILRCRTKMIGLNISQILLS